MNKEFIAASGKMLRKEARWRQFSQEERDHIRHMVDEGCGPDQISAYCKQIGKPWDISKVRLFFTKERKAALAEQEAIRCDLERSKMLREAYQDEGIEISEAMAFELSLKLRDAVKVSQADPNTADGRNTIRALAPNVIALRALDLRSNFDTKRLNQQERQLNLDLQKFQFDAAKASLKCLPRLRAIAGNKSLDEKSKIDAVRRELFGELPVEVAA